MSALYAMRYLGQTGSGFGAIYIGKGIVVGVDAFNGRYGGGYVEQNGRLSLNVTVSASSKGAQLVTGQSLQPGQSIPITGDWPTDFANGSPQQVTVAGHVVAVTLEKIGDIP